MSTREILCCYAHEDIKLLNKLKAHLKSLEHAGAISVWHDCDISAGMERGREIATHLNRAQIILLLISPDFMNSPYCYSIEMRRAMERHDKGKAQVIPIILRPVYWQGTPFDKLQVLPSEARPVTKWNNRDEAFVDIITGILRVIAQEPPEILAPASVQYASSRFTGLTMPIEKPSARKSDTSTCKHFRTGDLVSHHEFGHGMVNRTGLVGNKEFADVQFDQYGIRRIWEL